MFTEAHVRRSLPCRKEQGCAPVTCSPPRLQAHVFPVLEHAAWVFSAF